MVLDAATLPSEVDQRSLALLVEMAYELGVLERPQPQGEPMADVISSVGPSLDYADLTEFNADLNDTGVYNSGDVAIAEVENVSGLITDNFDVTGGSGASLTKVIVRAKSGDEHDGTPDTGAGFKATTSTTSWSINSVAEWAWLELEGTGTNRSYLDHSGSSLNGEVDIHHNQFRDFYNTISSGGRYWMDVNGADNLRFYCNCLCGFSGTSSGSASVSGVIIGLGSRTQQAYGNVAHDIDNPNASGAVTAFPTPATGTWQSNIASDVTSGGGTVLGFGATGTHSYNMTCNGSGDSSATGTGSLNDKTPSDQFVAASGPSYDLHLKSGADAIDPGSGNDWYNASWPDSELDVDEYDRNADASTVTTNGWDMGWHEFVSSGVDITANSALHSHTADSPAITQTHEIAVSEASHAHAADSPTVSQTHAVAVDEALHGHTADEPSLDIGVAVTVDEATHSHDADSPAITQTHEITADEAAHAHTADSPTLDTGSTVSVDDSLHDQTADSPTISQTHLIVVDSTLHAHVVDASNLTQNQLVLVEEALHEHTASIAVVSLGGSSLGSILGILAILPLIRGADLTVEPVLRGKLTLSGAE